MGDSFEKPRLIDFLYRDYSRIHSFFSQIFSGNLEEVAVTSSSSNTSESSKMLAVKVFEGERTTGKSDNQSIAKTIDPHDQRILDLMSTLDLAPTTDIPHSLIPGQILLISGSIAIRDYNSIKEAIPKLVKLNPAMFSEPGAQKKAVKQTTNTILSMFDIIPMGLEIEVKTSQEESLIGPLQSEYLSVNPNDLLRTYGTKIPGRWTILGIADPNVLSTDVDEGTNDLRASADGFAQAARLLYSSDSKSAAIIPILIYRYLTH